jgi:hypothetical protein
MTPTRFLIFASVLGGVGYWTGKWFRQNTENLTQSLSQPSLVVQPTGVQREIDTTSITAVKREPKRKPTTSVEDFCSNGQWELALEEYGKLPLPARQRFARHLGRCGGELDLPAIQQLILRTEDADERRALCKGMFASWTSYASDEASAFVAALPEGAEKRMQGSVLGEALSIANPRAGAKWLFASDFDALDDGNLKLATKRLAKASYADSKQLIDETPFSPERRTALEEIARTSWNQTCAGKGDWDKVIHQPANQ